MLVYFRFDCTCNSNVAKMCSVLTDLYKDVYTTLEGNKVLFTCALTTVLGLVAFRRFMRGTPCRSKAKLDGKTVLITGANTGIGKETARDLARRGARVLLACRDLTKAEQAAAEIRQSTGNPDVVVYKLDLTSLTSVRQCACDVIAQEHRLDVLINNAGVMATPHLKTVDGFELQFGTNHLGHFLLTHLLLELLKSSAPSRVVNVSALAYKWAGQLDFDDLHSEMNYGRITAYSRSKLANIYFTLELSKRLKGSKVTVNCLHPGVVSTELSRYMNNYGVFLLRWLRFLVFNGLIKHLLKRPIEGAQTSIHCAVATELEGVTGKYLSECAITDLSSTALDETAAAKVWAFSEEMVGIATNPST